MPRDPARSYPGARVASGEGLPKILAEEQALDDDFNSPWNRFKRFVADHALAARARDRALRLAVGRIARLARPRARHRCPRVPPGAARRRHPGARLRRSRTRATDSTDTVLATLLDLVDRGYYDTAQTTTDEEKLDLALEQKAERPNEELTVYEQDVLAFFDQLLDGKRLALSDMRDQIPEHSEVWRGRWERMTEKLDAADEGMLGWDRNLNWARWLTVLASSALIGVVVLLALAEEEPWFVAGAIGFVNLDRALGATGDPVQAPRSRPRRARRAMAGLRALDRGLPAPLRRPAGDARAVEADPRLRGRVRDRERMIASGPDPRAGRRGGVGRLPTGAPTRSSAASAARAFDGSSFSSGFSCQVAPESSSSGGGGGFSGGGGGGFSGGGGGGSW